MSDSSSCGLLFPGINCGASHGRERLGMGMGEKILFFLVQPSFGLVWRVYLSQFTLHLPSMAAKLCLVTVGVLVIKLSHLFYSDRRSWLCINARSWVQWCFLAFWFLFISSHKVQGSISSLYLHVWESYTCEKGLGKLCLSRVAASHHPYVCTTKGDFSLIYCHASSVLPVRMQ